MSDPFADFESAAPTGEDPVAAFLAREREELDKIENNDDFGGFASTTNNQNDAFGDAFGDASNEQSNQETNNYDNVSATPNTESLSNNNNNFDNTDFNDGSADDNSAGGQSAYSAISQIDRLASEPEKIKKWREEQRERLTKKDAEEEQKKKEWRESAKKELEDWYKNRQEQVEKTHAANKISNKAAEAELMAQRDSLAVGQEWERVAKLCDFNPKANKNNKDVSRMRSMLLQLKQSPLIRNAN